MKSTTRKGRKLLSIFALYLKSMLYLVAAIEQVIRRRKKDVVCFYSSFS
jgi:hypothetical protein